MRNQRKIEATFVARLVQNMEKLVNDERRSDTAKAIQIRAAWNLNRAKIRALLLARMLSHDPERRQRLGRTIELREKAGSYLRETSRWLRHKRRYPHSLRERPAIFSVPHWSPEPPRKAVPPPAVDYPFMEFSS